MSCPSIALVAGCLIAAAAISPHEGLAQVCEPGNYFQPAVPIATSAYAIESAVADLNGDGFLDIAVANYQGNTVSILLGVGDGTFTTGTPVPVAGGPRDIVAEDLNDDGRPDLVLVTLDNSSLVVLRNEGTSFTTIGPFGAGLEPRGLVVRDFDGDGIFDVAAGTANAMIVLRGLGSAGVWNGSFATPTAYSSPLLWSVDSGDLDGDGYLDVVGAANNTFLQIFYGTASGFSSVPFSLGASQGSVSIADIYVDGKPDLVVGRNNVAVLQNLGSRQFQAFTYSVPNVFNGLAVADFTHDAVLDVVGVIFGSNRMALLVGYGDGTFAAPEGYNVGVGSVGVTAADVSHDGGTDAIVCNTASSGISVLLSRCHGPIPPVITALIPSVGAVGDSVTIIGLALTDATEVQFNGIAAGYRVVNDLQLRAAIPAGATTGPVTVTTPLGTATSPTNFTIGPRPEVLLAVPDHAKRGATVALTGNHFTGTTRVSFGTGGPAPFQVNSDTDLSVLVDTTAVTGPIRVTNAFSTGISAFSFTVVPPDTAPRIVSVRDVPNDQGGRVFVRWLASDLDVLGKRYITSYRVWRRAGSTAALAPGQESLTRLAPDGVTVEFWEALATLPAAGLEGYAYVAPTTQDSLPTGNPLTAFFVQSLIVDPFTWFNSSPDSGYSVDNLAPPQPQPFVAVYGPNSVALHWGEVAAPDLAGYRLYRGLGVDFVPGPATLIASLADTGYVDAGRHDESVYKLSAVDLHGNPSHYAVVTPNGPTGVLVSLASADAFGGTVRLRWYAAGNPGLIARLERSTAVSPWERLATLVADAAGYLSYEDRDVVTGERYGYRLLVQNGDQETSYGETWLVIPPAELQLRVANPVTVGLEIDIALADFSPARIEVLDVAGRLLLARRLDGLGPGAHHLRLGNIDGRPGMLIVRLTQSGHTLVRRAARLR